LRFKVLWQRCLPLSGRNKTGTVYNSRTTT